MKSILDPSFKYTPAVSTDLKKTFARIRRLEREAAEREVTEPTVDAARKVVAIRPNGSGAK